VYYPDLSVYEYNRRPVPGVKNVGWLDTEHAFETGSLPSSTLIKIRWLASERRVCQSRGFHECPFCVLEHEDADWSRRSSAEIWVPDPDTGGFFAAPELVGHYVEAHGYLPPPVFVAAVDRLEIGDGVPDLDAACVAWMNKVWGPPPDPT
jgi:hypothetical protein